MVSNFPQPSEDLMTVNISIIPMRICNGTMSYNGVIPHTAICAGVLAGGRDSCQVTPSA